jgi:hypothetical protein
MFQVELGTCTKGAQGLNHYVLSVRTKGRTARYVHDSTQVLEGLHVLLSQQARSMTTSSLDTQHHTLTLAVSRLSEVSICNDAEDHVSRWTLMKTYV